MKKILLSILILSVITPYYSFAKNIVQLVPEAKPYHLKKDHTSKSNNKPTITGWVEHACIGDIDTKLKAKLDTGARTSSVNAEIIKIVKRGKNRFVLYRIIDEDFKSDVIEAKITRFTRIKSKRQDSDSIRRPVVMTEFKIGNTTIRDEVNLAERDHFSYPLLIGRNVLEKNFIIDASKKFTLRTQCQ